MSWSEQHLEALFHCSFGFRILLMSFLINNQSLWSEPLAADFNPASPPSCPHKRSMLRLDGNTQKWNCGYTVTSCLRSLVSNRILVSARGTCVASLPLTVKRLWFQTSHCEIWEPPTWQWWISQCSELKNWSCDAGLDVCSFSFPPRAPRGSTAPVRRHHAVFGSHLKESSSAPSGQRSGWNRFTDQFVSTQVHPLMRQWSECVISWSSFKQSEQLLSQQPAFIAETSAAECQQQTGRHSQLYSHIMFQTNTRQLSASVWNCGLKLFVGK